MTKSQRWKHSSEGVRKMKFFKKRNTKNSQYIGWNDYTERMAVLELHAWQQEVKSDSCSSKRLRRVTLGNAYADHVQSKKIVFLSFFM